jgi:hypothetical protein
LFIDSFPGGCVRITLGQLSHAFAVFAREHIDHDKVIVTVAIDIGEIDAHGGAAGVPDFPRIDEPKGSFS